MKRMIILLLTLAFLFAMTGCGAKKAAAPASPVTFKVVVTDLDGNESTFTYTSGAADLGEALIAEGLIEGRETEFGLFIETVNGITADWDADQTYWAFYIDGEYAVTTMDATQLTADATYGLTLTKD